MKAHFFIPRPSLFYNNSMQAAFDYTNRQLNMNEPLKERKSSTNRLSTISSKTNFNSGEAKKKLCSAKKGDGQQSKQQGKYLLGWGALPVLDTPGHSLQIINKDIVAFAAGETHLLFLNSKGELYGVGSAQYGQLGPKNTPSTSTITRLFEDISHKQVYATEYATFLIDTNNQLYACGLNSRGQLGLPPSPKLDTPHLISRLSQPNEPYLNKNHSRSRISSIYYQQIRRDSCDLQNQAQDSNRSRYLLENKEVIIDIRGGPLHTIVLTSKGRVFYAGNFYKSSSLAEDQFISEFIELNTAKLGKIIAVKSYLTGVIFCTNEGRLYLLGVFGSAIYDEPFFVEGVIASKFDINDNGLFIVDINGQLLFYSLSKEINRIERLSLGQKAKDVHCGMDYVIAIGEKTIFGQGNNSFRQLMGSSNNYATFAPLQLSFPPEEGRSIKCHNNFVLTLSNTPTAQTPQAGSKLRDIERENKILKQLLCNKHKKSVKIQTDKQSNFQIQRPLNARIFDTSLEIPFEELKLGRQISEGGYGIIYKATWRKSTVAVKIFKIERENANSVKDFVSQCHAMQALRHPNIVMFLGACTRPPHFAIVLEFCEGGTLWSLLQKQGEIGWEERRGLALDTAKAINYLHQRPVPVLHRDLKSLNLLLDHNKRVKLADFGWTKGLQNYMTGKIGTYQWMAPEVISGNQYTQKADVYSFGIILWEIASREAPYRNIPGIQVAQDVLNKDLRPNIPKKTPQPFSQLIKNCWAKSPQRRPSFSEIIQRLQSIKLC